MSFCSCFGHTQLRETDSLPRPVVLVEAEDAEELMGLVNKNEEAKVRIEIMMEQPRWVSTETNAHTHTRQTFLSLAGTTAELKGSHEKDISRHVS